MKNSVYKMRANPEWVLKINPCTHFMARSNADHCVPVWSVVIPFSAQGPSLCFAL